MDESERRKHTRDYFEQGCLCIQGGVVQKLDSVVDDRSAIAYYEKACRCSRNYVEHK